MKDIRFLIPSIKSKIKNLHNEKKLNSFFPEINENEEYYLSILYSLQNPTFTEFAEAAEITKPAATQIIKKLVEKGYVEKNQSKEDRRVYFLSLNNTIKNSFEESYLYLDKIYEYCLTILNEDEKYHLKNILFKVNKALHTGNLSDKKISKIRKKVANKF